MRENPDTHAQFEDELTKTMRENSEAITQATRMLGNIGLSLEDLKNKRSVLDLGSGRSYIGKAAQVCKYTSVISMDRDINNFSADDKLIGKVAANALKIPLPDSSMELVIAHGSVPAGKKSEEESLTILKEMIRVTSVNGELRICPAFLRFIEEANRDTTIQEIYKKQAEQSAQSGKLVNFSPEHIADLVTHYQKITALSTQYLKDKGFKVEVLENNNTNIRNHPMHYYWIIKK